jgi:hypothetical protein
MENGDAGMMSGLGGMLGIGMAFCFFAVGFALTAFLLVGLWKMFVKAGQPGWAALVPVYNLYVLVQLVGLPVHWFYYLVILNLVGGLQPSLSLFTSIGSIVLSFYVVRLLLRAYGQTADTVNVIISLFVPVILTYRAGFGSAQYLGPQSLHDVPNLPWISNMSSTPPAALPPASPPAGGYIPTLSSNVPNDTATDNTPLVDNQPLNVPPVSGGPTDPGVDMGSVPQMGSGNNKDQQQ